MDKEAKAIRKAVIEELELLARASLQAKYESDVPVAYIPAELVCRFCDDLFHPKSQTFLDAFSEEEIKDLAALYGLLRIASKAIDDAESLTVADLHKKSEWRSVMNLAKELRIRFNVSGK